jgi:hypothetical protein
VAAAVAGYRRNHFIIFAAEAEGYHRYVTIVVETACDTCIIQVSHAGSTSQLAGVPQQGATTWRCSQAPLTSSCPPISL